MPGSRPRPVPRLFVHCWRIYNSAMHTAKNPLISRRLLSYRSQRSLRAVRDGLFVGGMADYRHGVVVVELGSCGCLDQKPVKSTRRSLSLLSHGPTRRDFEWKSPSCLAASLPRMVRANGLKI